MAVPSLAANLPWQALQSQGAALGGLGGDPAQAMAQLGPMYQNSYNSALNLNASLFNGLQTGYDTLRSDVDQKYADISKGYQDLYGDVLGRIAGTNQTNLSDINTAYNAQSGKSSQDLISRGLGNSTTQSAIQRGIELDRQRALTNSNNQFAQLGANYANQIGQAGLQNRTQGTNVGAGLGQAQLGSLERTQVPYPNAAMYTDLARMYGAQVEGQKNRADLDAARNPFPTLFGGSGGAVSGGTVGQGPMRTPGYNPGGFYSPTTGSGFGGSLMPGYNPSQLASMGFQSGFNQGNDVGGGGFSDPMAMGAVGGGAMAALGWGGFGTLPDDGAAWNSGYSDTGGWVPPADTGYGDTSWLDSFSGY